MRERIQVLAEKLTGKASLADCSREEVEALVTQYPYFGPARFLLLEKLRDTDPQAYAAQLQKAILYYPDPLYFQYLVSPESFYTEVPEEATADESFFTAGEMTAEPPVVSEPEPEAITGPEAGVTGVEPELEGEAIALEPQVEEEIPVTAEPTNMEEGVAVPASASDEAAPEVKAEAAVQAPAEVEKVEAPAAAGLTFEPFHTVDYFASQGIRLSSEEQPKDKFGKQLKSFTEWLKTMKRLPADQVAAADASTEKKVATLAQDSIHEADVWTEAMAEVWIKQGNPSRAREVYQKLSLLNPSKMAYFAAKIENLKS
jgi:hypothetical protein